MTELIARGPAEARSANALLDQSAQAGSPEKTSIKTLESTRVAITLFQALGAPILSPGEAHYLLGRHRNISATCAFQALDHFPATAVSPGGLADPNLVSVLEELDFGAGQKAEPIPKPLRDRHLAFAGDPHEVRVLQVLLLLKRSLGTQLGVVPVPVEGADQPVAQLDLGAPAGQLAQLGRVDELAIDLARGVAGPQVFGLEVGARDG